MLGLLGGLLGAGLARRAASRPLGGLLAGRMVRNAMSSRRGGMSQGGAPEDAPQAQEGQQEEQAPATQPAPPVQQAELQADSPAVQTAQAGGQVTEKLLDPPPPVEQPKPQAEDKVAPPAQIANTTDTSSPVAMVQGDQYPSVPQTPLSGLTDQIGDAPPPRNIPFEDPVPMRQADVKSQAKHTANRPDMSFGLANTSTAYAPRYSYRGR